MSKLTDESLMPWGAHKGKRMIDVPSGYLLYLSENGLRDRRVQEYIDDNLDVLNKENKE